MCVCNVMAGESNGLSTKSKPFKNNPKTSVLSYVLCLVVLSTKFVYSDLAEKIGLFFNCGG